MSGALDPCPLCGGPCVGTEHGGTAFEECARCGFGRVAEPWEPAEYWAHAEGRADVGDVWRGAKERYYVSALRLLEDRTGGPVRLLDLGGGVGHFAHLGIGRGWDAYSLDVSPVATRIAAERLGTDRALTELGADQAGTFDAVTMWCVIAHVPDPFPLMRLAAEALRPGGVLWLTTPNFSFQKPYAALRTRVGKPLDVRADDHLLHFTPAALARLLARAGFGRPSFQHRGVVERCNATGTSGGALIAGKRAWNRAAILATRVGAPNLVSELQAVAYKVSTPA